MFLIILLYTYIKMVIEYHIYIKDIKQGKDIKIFLKKKMKKSVNIIGIEIKTFLKKKNKRKLNI